MIVGVSAELQNVQVEVFSGCRTVFSTTSESVLTIELLLVEKVGTHRSTHKGWRKEEGVVRQQTDTRQIPGVSIPSKQAVQYLEACLCRKAAVVQASPAAWAPCEENKV